MVAGGVTGAASLTALPLLAAIPTAIYLSVLFGAKSNIKLAQKNTYISALFQQFEEKREEFASKSKEQEAIIDQARTLLKQGKEIQLENVMVCDVTVTHADRSSPDGGTFESKAKYLILEEIGAGGMATVYRAYNLTRDRKEVLKIAHFQYATDREYRERFFLEAKQLEFFHYPKANPNVVKVYGSGKINIDGVDTLFIAMERIDGISLATVLEIVGSLKIAEAVRIMTDVATAMKALHEKGIVHRDIKPENIMVQIGENDAITVKIIDFGIAKDTRAAKTLTAKGVILGTPEYMSLEQIKGGELDYRTDLYAEGALFFELLTGSCLFPPVEGEATPQYIWRVINLLEKSVIPDIRKQLFDVDQKKLVGVIRGIRDVLDNTLVPQEHRYRDEDVFIRDLRTLKDMLAELAN